MTHQHTKSVLSTNQMAELQKSLIDEYQHELPLSPTPYADIARHLQVDEVDVIEALRTLQKEGTVSRVGFVFRPHRVGTSTLAAMAVPKERLEEVAELVNHYPQVNHNYEREHHYNLWFVLTAEDDKELLETLDELEYVTQLPVIPLPMLDDYHIDLGFDLKTQAACEIKFDNVEPIR
ncbi:Lrp/AsnC family transcriptional regulator [Pseudomonadota bacterium]